MIFGKITAVIFDVDRTLWDFDKNSREVLADIFLPFAQNLNVPVQKMIYVYEHYNFLLWAEYQKNKIDRDTLRIKRFSALLNHFEINQDDSAKVLAESYVDLCPRKVALVDGTLEVLEYLKSKYQLHVLTNGFGPVQKIKLENTGLNHYFKFVVSPEMVGCKKPCKKIFHYTAGRAKIKNLSEALYIGDEFSTDFIGATQAGMQCLHYDAHLTHQTDKRISHLKELMTLL